MRSAAALPRDRPLRIVDLGCGTGSTSATSQRSLRGCARLAAGRRGIPPCLRRRRIRHGVWTLGRRDAPEVFAGRDLVTGVGAARPRCPRSSRPGSPSQCRVERRRGAIRAHLYRPLALPLRPSLEGRRHLRAAEPASAAERQGIRAHGRPWAPSRAPYTRSPPPGYHVPPRAERTGTSQPEAIASCSGLLMQGWADAALELTPFEADTIRRLARRAASPICTRAARASSSRTSDLAAFPSASVCAPALSVTTQGLKPAGAQRSAVRAQMTRVTRGSASASDGSGASCAQLAVEEDVAAHPEDAILRPVTVAERGARRQADRRPAVADQQGATATCRRSRRPAARNIETVTPPPSMKIRAQPRLAQQRHQRRASRSRRRQCRRRPAMCAQPTCVSPRR